MMMDLIFDLDSDSTKLILFAMILGCVDGNTNLESVGFMISLTPPTSVASGNTPHARASNNTSGSIS